MQNNSHGGSPADQDLGAAWARFEQALAGYLAGMEDAADHLLVELPGDDATGAAPYVQFAGSGAATLHAEVSSNAFLHPAFRLDARQESLLDGLGFALLDDADPANYSVEVPVAEAATLARRIVLALRDVFAIPHPHLLSHRAWGPAAQHSADLGLSASDDVTVETTGTADGTPPADPEVRPLRKALYHPQDRDALVALVARLLAHKFQGAPEVDDDGDFVLTHRDQQVWVRVRREQPAIEVMARVTRGVHSRRATAVELAVLNRHHAWVTWDLIGRDVWQRLFLPGVPFVPAHLDGLLDAFWTTMTETRDDLALRVGGRKA